MRKRLTERFPFLLPLRKWQRNKVFYLKMKLDSNKYTTLKCSRLLPFTIFKTEETIVNEESGYPIVYQHNKAHNLKVAAAPINRLVIAPGETFSFWHTVRDAGKSVPYKDGLNLVNGEIVPTPGGGLCQLSNMLYWMFLHTPLTILERHGHGVLNFPHEADSKMPLGVDATISEGWLDLKVTNNTKNTFQIVINFDSEKMYGQILSEIPIQEKTEIYNSDVSYHRKDNHIYQVATVCKVLGEDKADSEVLYINESQVAYNLPEEILATLDNE